MTKRAKQVEPTSVAAGLADQLTACQAVIDAHCKEWDSAQELMRLFAGLYVFFLMPVMSEHDNERRAINAVLRSRIGLGFSWYSCLKYLSGARAKTIFAAHGDVVRAAGGSEMMLAFNQIMPTLPDVLAKIDREVRRSS